MPRPPAFVALGGGGDQDDEELDRQNSKHNLLNKTYNFDNDEDEDFEGQDEADRIIHSPTTTTAGGLGRGRVASFEFDQYAIPLSLSLVNKYGDLDDLGKSIGLLNGLALIIGCVVGSGIFAR